MRLEEGCIAGIDRMGPPQAAADNRDRLRAASTFAIRARRVGAANCIDAQIAELAVEKAVIGAAAEFTVSDEFKAYPLLQPDDGANRIIFGGNEFGFVDLPFANRARRRSNSAGRRRLPICSARNGGLDAIAFDAAWARTFTA
jgi:hypothetical protein